jgi:hypothetical protein
VSNFLKELLFAANLLVLRVDLESLLEFLLKSLDEFTPVIEALFD